MAFIYLFIYLCMYVFIYLFIYLSWYSTHRGSIELSVPLDYSPQQTKKLPVKVQN